MNEEDYPALFRSAEAASKFAQRAYLTLVATQSLLLVLAATLALLPSNSPVIAALSAGVFFVSLPVTIFARIKNYQRIWYQARALAESIKTACWNFMMVAEPFSTDSIVSKRTFQDRIRELLKENESLGDYFAGTSVADAQLTDRVCEIRNLSLNEKIAFYREHRIREQRSWYSSKAVDYRKRGRIWFATLVCLYVLAAICALTRIAAPQFKFYPAGVLAVAASGVLTWIQAKKYSEIAAAYNLTSHEIGTVEEQLRTADSSESFSTFVANAESAFSREHTQWAARRRE